MIQDLLGSIASTQAYRRFAVEKASRTVLYIFFVSLIFSVIGTIAVKLTVGPILNETFAWLAAEVPTLTFSSGKVTSAVTTPKRLAHPASPTVAIMIDTSRIDPLTSQEMQEAKVIAYLTSNAFYIEQQSGKIEVYDLSKAALERPVIVDSKFFREAARGTGTAIYFFVAFGTFALAAFSTPFAATIFALVGTIIQSFAGGNLAFGALFQMAVHAQTSSLIVWMLMFMIPMPPVFTITLMMVVTPLITLGYLTMGIKANAAAAAETSAI